MRTLAMALGCVMVLQPTAWALCRSDQKLAIVGTLATDSAVISNAAKEVRLISMTCGASACLAGIYDTATVGGISTATARFEIGAAANETVFLDQLLTFTSGVTFLDNGNVAAVSVFECADR